MEKLLEYLAKEWSVVSSAPLVFCTVAVLMFSIAFLVAGWRYTSVIEQLGVTIQTLREQVTFLEKKNKDALESSPDVLLQRYEKRIALLEQELVQIEKEKAPLADQIASLKTQLVHAENIQIKQRQQLTFQLEDVIQRSASLEARSQQLQQRIREIEEPYERFLYYANATVSPGRQQIVREIVSYLGVATVLSISPDKLIEAFSRIAEAVNANGMLSNPPINKGAMTGLRSVGIIDQNDQLTLVGVSVFKSIAREMNANQ
jgi:predicted PurR-regulated permease PerM